MSFRDAYLYFTIPRVSRYYVHGTLLALEYPTEMYRLRTGIAHRLQGDEHEPEFDDDAKR